MEIHKKYSLVKEHEKHFEIHDSTDGRVFKVAKKEMHPATQIKIMKMQKFDSGGDVKGSDVEGFDSGIKPWVKDSVKDSGDNTFFGLFPSDQEMYGPSTTPAAAPQANSGPEQYVPPSVQAPQVPPPATSDAPQLQAQEQPQTAAPAAQPQVMYPQGTPTVASVTGLENQQVQGLNMQAQGQIAQNKAMTDIYTQEVNRQQAAQKIYEERMASHQEQLDNLSKQVAETKIDPNKYWHEKGAASKVAAGIAVILSGIGSGLGGGRNQAMDVIQKNIDRDIETQKDNLGKTQSLISDNLRVQGNLTQAENATRLQYSAMLQGQLAKAAAQTGNPIIIGRTQQQIAELRMRDVPLKQEVAQHEMQRRMMQGMGGGSAEQRIAMLSSNPAEAEAASKELQAVKNHASQTDNIISAFDKSSQENTVLGRTGRLGFEPPAVAGFKTLMMPYLKDAEGRINEQELQRTDAMLPSPGDRPSTVSEKRKMLMQFLTEKKPPTAHLQKYGILPEKYGRLDSGGNSKIKEGPVQ